MIEQAADLRASADIDPSAVRDIACTMVTLLSHFVYKIVLSAPCNEVEATDEIEVSRKRESGRCNPSTARTCPIFWRSPRVCGALAEEERRERNPMPLF